MATDDKPDPKRSDRGRFGSALQYLGELTKNLLPNRTANSKSEIGQPTLLKSSVRFEADLGPGSGIRGPTAGQEQRSPNQSSRDVPSQVANNDPVATTQDPRNKSLPPLPLEAADTVPPMAAIDPVAKQSEEVLDPASATTSDSTPSSSRGSAIFEEGAIQYPSSARQPAPLSRFSWTTANSTQPSLRKEARSEEIHIVLDDHTAASSSVIRTPSQTERPNSALPNRGSDGTKHGYGAVIDILENYFGSQATSTPAPNRASDTPSTLNTATMGETGTVHHWEDIPDSPPPSHEDATRAAEKPAGRDNGDTRPMSVASSSRGAELSEEVPILLVVNTPHIPPIPNEAPRSRSEDTDLKVEASRYSSHSRQDLRNQERVRQREGRD